MSANTPAGESYLALIAIALGVAFLVSLAPGRPAEAGDAGRGRRGGARTGMTQQMRNTAGI
jgi:hypothetical protein